MLQPSTKQRMHPRNRFREGYEFRQLIARSGALARHVRPNAYGTDSIDYADPDAVKALNQALLREAYGLKAWNVPRGYLCPPIPGRSDYVHYLADLLAGGNREIPRGRSVTVLDIGVGAGCIYPLIGASEYGWRFVGSEIDAVALDWAEKLRTLNPPVAGLIELRLQPARADCFRGVIHQGECFALSMCNPPFHASAAEASAGALRKQRNLGTVKSGGGVLNFGGKATELWCPGGELAFVLRMIAQSVAYRNQCRWFTTLVSKSANLPRLERALLEVEAANTKIIEMGQGQKRSRVLAWTFDQAASTASGRPARSPD